MILVDRQINELIEKGELVIEPFDKELLGPTSYDVTLSNHFTYYYPQVFEPSKPPSYKDFTIKSNECVLLIPPQYRAIEFDDYIMLRSNFPPDLIIHPDEINLAILEGQYAIFTSLLGSTNEYIELPSYISAEYTGRSSWGRLFLQSHQTAGWIDAGFCGRITLELMAYEAPVVLRPGTKIGQLIFYKHDRCSVPYNKRKSSKYNYQQGAIPSRLYYDFTKV